MYQGLRDYWMPVVVGAVLAGLFLIRYLRTDSGRLMRDRVLLRIPLLGPLFVKAAIARFASIFALLQVSGVPVLDSLTILSRTIGNAAISGQFDRIRDQLVEGRGIAGPLSRARYFSPMVINMVAVGEESGNLAEMLREVSSHYDTEVEYATKRLADAVGPMLTIGLAAVVGFFALAIYMPMWDLAKMAQ